MGLRRIAAGAVPLVTLSAALVIPLVAPATANAVPTESTPSTSTPSTSEVKVEPNAPMPVADGAIGYTATPQSTRWLADRKPEDVISNLPSPPTDRKSNEQMAEYLGLELDAAVENPGACLQVIVNPPLEQGGMFNYGFFAVEREYCPR
ncbi:hypothetical protein [Gordonia zhaorongruii]|uniref:hypothetical protein n=1 Tax=Gordonia zhaorongruii TaxID=2597659 RepID=UPI0010481EEC|nr:hypothetical protein [Gordonia zhaorongruii]